MVAAQTLPSKITSFHAFTMTGRFFPSLERRVRFPDPVIPSSAQSEKDLSETTKTIVLNNSR